MTKHWGLTIFERSLLVSGAVLLTIHAGMHLYGWASSRRALQEFDTAQTAEATGCSPQELPYREILAVLKSPPLAVLRIEKANLRAPVFEGTDELALNRGAGWIAGTARPGEAGNIGIAGHRDGVFRGLKDVSPGDAIELSTIRETAVYTVDQIEIVRPENVSVLRPRAAPSLTLVTCYPFYFVGNAPKRYILHASLRERASNRKLEAVRPARTQTFDNKEIRRND